MTLNKIPETEAHQHDESMQGDQYDRHVARVVVAVTGDEGDHARIKERKTKELASPAVDLVAGAGKREAILSPFGHHPRASWPFCALLVLQDSTPRPTQLLGRVLPFGTWP